MNEPIEEAEDGGGRSDGIVLQTDVTKERHCKV